MERVKSAFHFLGFQLLTEQKLSQHIVKWWFPWFQHSWCARLCADVQIFIFMFSTYIYVSTCILHCTSSESTSTRVCFPTSQPWSSAGTCAQHSWGRCQCPAVLIPPQVLKAVPWLMSLERVQPAPLVPPAPANWHKGQEVETEARAWPAPLSTCPREKQQSCLCSAFKCQGRGSSSHPYQRVCLSQRAPSKY